MTWMARSAGDTMSLFARVGIDEDGLKNFWIEDLRILVLELQILAQFSHLNGLFQAKEEIRPNQ